MKGKLTGRPIYAGNLTVNGDEITGIAIEISKEALMGADSLLLYQECIILTVAEYQKILNERDNAVSDSIQSEESLILALHDRNYLRSENARMKGENP